MCECGGSLGVTHPATFTHWPASERRSLPRFILLFSTLPTPNPPSSSFLPINLLLPSWWFRSRIKPARDFLFTLSPLPSSFTLLLTHLSFQHPPLDIVLWRVLCPPYRPPHLLLTLFLHIFCLFCPGEPVTDHMSTYPPMDCYFMALDRSPLDSHNQRGRKSRRWQTSLMSPPPDPGDRKMEVWNPKVTVVIESALMQRLWHYEAPKASRVSNPTDNSLICTIGMKCE